METTMTVTELMSRSNTVKFYKVLVAAKISADLSYDCTIQAYCGSGNHWESIVNAVKKIGLKSENICDVVEVA